MDLSGRSPDPRRAGARILDTAEGVLIALRGCSLNQAFVEIVQTAKSHNVSTLSLADALVSIAQTQASQNVDDAAFAAAHATWGQLLTGPDRAAPCGHHRHDLTTTRTRSYPALRRADTGELRWLIADCARSRRRRKSLSAH